MDLHTFDGVIDVDILCFIRCCSQNNPPPLHYLNDNRTYLDLKAEMIGSDNRLQEEISGTTATIV
jgi:hypothetical protein